VIGSAGVLQGIAYDSGSRTVWAGAGTLYAVVLDPGNETVAAYVGVDPSGVTYNSDNGNVCVTNAGNQTFECISFPNSVTSPTVNLSFNESGLPSGQPWSVTIGPYGPTQNSTTSQIEVQVLPGQAYAYQVGTLDPLYYASPSSGTVAVPSSTTVSVSFFPYNASQAPASVSFQEDPLSSPLPYDTSYWVDIDGLSLPGTSVVPGDVNFTLGPGDYTWTVLPINGYSVAPFTSSLYVSGPGTQIVNLSFFAIGNSSLPVQFTATGLPADAYWGLDIPGLSNGGQTGPTLSFGMRAGAYNFTVGPPAGFSASPSYGVFNVYGGLLNIVISFSGNGTIYPVTFNETGLPSGALWSVEMDGEWQETSASGLLFYEPNGTYSFEVYDGNGSGPYVPNPSSGVVDLDGAGASVAITFGSAPVTFPVLFVETGLVFGTVWSVTFFNSTYGTDGTTLNASAPNGTYSFTVGNVSGYSPNPASGTVTIAGAALAVNISFSTVPAAEQFAVDVVESGLPSGSDWTATLNGTSYNSTTPTIVFIESNGTYTLDVFATSANYTANYSSPVAVDGAAVAVGVTFSANTYLVTFLESGLAAGTSWTVTAVDEATQVATPGQSNGAEIALRLPEGTYGLTATGPTGDRVSITPSSLDVNGASPSPVTVAYTSLNPGGVAPGALPIPLVVEAGVITLLLASLAAAWGYSSYRYGRRRAEGEEWVRELQAEARETDDPRIRSYSAPHAPTVAAPRRGRRTRRRTTHPPSRPPYGPIGMTTGWAELLAAAAVGGAAGWLGNYLWTHRRAPVSLPPGSRPDESSVTAPAPRAGVEPLAAPLSPGATVERADPAPATAASAEEGLGLARRIILHLAGLGRLGYDEVARVGFTQQDMASALSARQGSLVRVLRRLEAAEVLTVDRRHVSGVPRRLKVYRPTSLGESIARDLRHPTDGAPRGTGSPRAPPPVRPSTAGDWVVQRSSTEARHP
jgi:DNA-binding PadR family transcriptional regulator